MNAKQAAKFLNEQHMRYSAGFYSNNYPRCFQARVKDGKLQIHDWDRWFTVEPGTIFRCHNGRELFTFGV